MLLLEIYRRWMRTQGEDRHRTQKPMYTEGKRIEQKKQKQTTNKRQEKQENRRARKQGREKNKGKQGKETIRRDLILKNLFPF